MMIKWLLKTKKKKKEKEDKEENISFTRNMFKKFGIDITERGTTILTYMVAYHSLSLLLLESCFLIDLY